jgi:DNA polymerase IV (DinB-like DNA polymerase)
MGVLRIIAHVDMDAIFAAIEERDAPALRGFPLVVRAEPPAGRDEASCRQRTIEPASMYPFRDAYFHRLASLRSRAAEGKAGRHVRSPGHEEICSRVGTDYGDRATIEQASIDEAYGDVSLTGSYESAEHCGRSIKGLIRNETGLTASVGIGPNKLVAKIASGVRKPMD